MFVPQILYFTIPVRYHSSMSKNQIKDQIRQQILPIRRQLSQSFQQSASLQIISTIQAWPEFQRAKHIGVYQAMQGEVDLSLLWREQLSYKTFYFPMIIEPQSLVFLPIDQNTVFTTNRLGILEPVVPQHLAIHGNELQILFMPLVAFDLNGTRLGMGRGYYDRSLSPQTNHLRVGIAYEFQKQNHLPTDPWDIFLHGAITESTTYWFSAPNLL